MSAYEFEMIAVFRDIVQTASSATSITLMLEAFAQRIKPQEQSAEAVHNEVDERSMKTNHSIVLSQDRTSIPSASIDSEAATPQPGTEKYVLRVSI
jgi:hypothetical protein